MCLFAIHGCPKSLRYWWYQSDVTVCTTHEALLGSLLGLLLLLHSGRIRKAVLNLILASQRTPTQTILHEQGKYLLTSGIHVPLTCMHNMIDVTVS